MSTWLNSSNLTADLPYWVGLSTFAKFGPKRFALLRQCFPAMRAVWEATAAELRAAGVSQTVAEEFVVHRQKINFISLHHLKINKKATGRDQDKIDLKNLP